MAVRLSKKGIILLVVLGLLLLGGVTGYLVWTVYYQDNVAPTDSDAGENGCNGEKNKKDCEAACSPEKGTPPKSYECTWTGTSCKDSNKTCAGSGDGGHVCDDVVVDAVNGPKKCNLGSPPVCQKSKFAPFGNTGYSCTCLDQSGQTCKTDWQCTTLDLKACPTDTIAPPKFNCVVSGNCISLPSGLATTWVEHRCEGRAESNGDACNVSNPIEHPNQKSFCMSKPADFCGWIQVDSEGYPDSGCFGSWYFPCEGGETETPLPPSCTSLSLTSTQTEPTSPLNLFSTDETLTATLTADDPDGNPSKVKICYSVRGQSNTFYANAANWVCDEKATSKTLTVSRTAQDYINSYAAKVTTFTPAQVEEAGLRFMSEITDNTNGTVCTSNPSVATGSNSVIVGTGANCGNICRATVDFQAAPTACGDGILDTGEVCDPGATEGTPANTCAVGSCTAMCTCPEVNPGFDIQKVPVMQCVESDQTYADVRYTIVATNNGTTVGHLSQVTDDLDPKVQRDWIIQSSISPSEGVSIGEVADGPEGLEIVWTLETAAQTFDPGESMTFTYVIRIPQANFGTYRNVVTGIVTDEGEENITDEAIIDVSCLPGTGLFDNTVARIALASILLIAGAYFAQSGSLDGFAFKLFTKSGQVERKRETFEGKI